MWLPAAGAPVQWVSPLDPTTLRAHNPTAPPRGTQNKYATNALTFSCSGCTVTNNNASLCGVLHTNREDEIWDDDTGDVLPGAALTVDWASSKMSGVCA